MEYLVDSWSFVLILFSAFLIGWTAEAAQTFMPRALAFTVLAWLQTLPEFAVEATIAWNQQRDLMIANLTGSLRLLVGLGWPMIFFVHFFFQGTRKRRWISEIKLDPQDALSVVFLFIVVVYFIVILAKGNLNCIDAGVLITIYAVYLYLATKSPSHEVEEEDDLPWVARKVVSFSPPYRTTSVVVLFLFGGWLLYVSAHPFVETLQKWSVAWGMSTFVFVQWVAPFLSEFPEKVSAFNWARQEKKAPMAIMNMVSSNVNQWTLLAAMIPLVFSLSVGRWEHIEFDSMHSLELGLTIAQSLLGGLLLLDLQFSIWDAIAVFVLWVVQFINAGLREEVAWVYVAWIVVKLIVIIGGSIRDREWPAAIRLFPESIGMKK